jgi:hypothetical protein
MNQCCACASLVPLMQATVSPATCLCAVQRISKTLCTTVRQLLLHLSAEWVQCGFRPICAVTDKCTDYCCMNAISFNTIVNTTTTINKQRIQSEHRGLKAKTRLKTDVIKQQERLLSDQRDALAEAKGSLTAAQAEAREADARAAQVTHHYCYITAVTSHPNVLATATTRSAANSASITTTARSQYISVIALVAATAVSSGTTDAQAYDISLQMCSMNIVW